MYENLKNALDRNYLHLVILFNIVRDLELDQLCIELENVLIQTVIGFDDLEAFPVSFLFHASFQEYHVFFYVIFHFCKILLVGSPRDSEFFPFEHGFALLGLKSSVCTKVSCKCQRQSHRCTPVVVFLVKSHDRHTELVALVDVADYNHSVLELTLLVVFNIVD